MGFLKKRAETTIHDQMNARKWKILIVDDEEAIHQATRFALNDFLFDNHPVEFISAMNAEEAKEKFLIHSDIALALIDVVMENDHAGLDLVQYIRNELKNTLVRIVLRTGQPGQAPEKFVIDNYDINDYKEKTELTQIKLYSVVRTALKAYSHLLLQYKQKKALEYFIKSAPLIYEITSLKAFFETILAIVTQLIVVIEENSVDKISSYILYPVAESGSYKICYTLSDQQFSHEQTIDDNEIRQIFELLDKGPFTVILENNKIVIPIKDKNNTVALIFIEGVGDISTFCKHTLDLFSMQASVSFKNIDLYDLLSQEHYETIKLLARASEYKDEDTGDHIKRIERITKILAEELGYSENQAEMFAKASILHDIGKLSVDDYILRKPAKLSEEEFAVIKRHTINGAKILEGHSYFALEKEIAMYHHEKWDGTGYPKGLKGEEIPIGARIVAIADVYDALTHERPYKEAWSQEKTLAYFQEQSGKHFDPKLVEILLTIIDKLAL